MSQSKEGHEGADSHLGATEKVPDVLREGQSYEEGWKERVETALAIRHRQDACLRGEHEIGFTLHELSVHFHVCRHCRAVFVAR